MKKTVIFSIIIIILDQILKLFISNMNVLESITIIPNFFSITYVKNTGAAFSILNGNTFLLIILSIIILFYIYKFILKKNIHKISSILLLGGILANLIDRIFRGYVVDYLDFNILGYNFPIFNLADICIVIGSFILIFETLKDSEETR